MPHDEVISELWRIKDEIAAECNYDVHALVRSLREDEEKHPRDFIALDGAPGRGLPPISAGTG